MTAAAKPGPLAGLTVVEMAGIGPVPLAGLMLSEFGASVVRVERMDAGRPFFVVSAEYDLDRHGRDVLKLDLKRSEGIDLLLRLVDKADILIEGYRPGVMERLGLGPDIALARNPALIYGRMTGFGQDGPLSRRAGHDLTYLAYSGILHAIGPKGGKPVPPLNLVADYGGGTMFLVTGVLAALVERGRSGLGQVVDATMIDGASMLAAPTFAFLAAGFWKDARGANLLDSGAPFYDTYETADGGHVAVGALEPQFYAALLEGLGVAAAEAPQFDMTGWPALHARFAEVFASRDRDEWAAHFAGTDACVTPVLTVAEAPGHPHNAARGTFVKQGVVQPAPAPRFDGAAPTPEPQPEPLSIDDALARWT